MTMKKRLADGILQIMLVLYGYVLIKIILFKFRPVDLSLLWQQLEASLRNPDMLLWRLQQGNLIPFTEIARTVQDLSAHGVVNLVGNVVIFIPFGLLLGLLRTRLGIAAAGAFLLSLAVSLCLESAQLMYMIGQFDVDDLILNSTGGWVGFLLFLLLRRAFAPMSA